MKPIILTLALILPTPAIACDLGAEFTRLALEMENFDDAIDQLESNSNLDADGRVFIYAGHWPLYVSPKRMKALLAKERAWRGEKLIKLVEKMQLCK